MAKLFMLSFDGIDVVVPALLLKEEEDEAFIVIICSRARMAFSRLSKTSDFGLVSLNQSVPLENRLCLKKKSVVSKANLKRLSKLLPPYESFRWLLMRLFPIVQFERYVIIVTSLFFRGIIRFAS